MNQLKKRILLITALILSMSLLSGCMVLNAMTEALSSEPQVIPPTTAESTLPSVPSVSETTIQPASEKSFTGIAANLPDDGSVILASDMYDGQKAELLLADPDSLGYRISLYTAATGEMTDAFAGTLTGPVSGSDSAYYLKRDNFTVLSSAPLVFEDRLAKTVYCFAGDFSAVTKIDISAWNMCSMVFSKTDSCLYYESYSDSGLYRCPVGSGEPSCIFTPGPDYDSVRLESILGNAGIAVFSGVRALDRAFVDVLVDLKTGAVQCEITGDVDLYESDRGIYAVRTDGNRILVALFDPAALSFAPYCEIDFDSYYTDMYVDGSSGLLFLCTWRDGRSYLVSCYDLEMKRLLYSDPFDVTAYSAGQVPADGEAAATDFAGLSFGGQSPYSKDSNALMMTTDSQGVIRDVIFWNLNEAQTPDLYLGDTQDWDEVDCIKPGLTADSDTNAAYAAEISDEFGVQVLIGENAKAIFPDYTLTMMDDEVQTYRSLCTLEEALRLFPDGFFKEFIDGHTNGIVFYVVARINSTQDDASDDLCGFAYSDTKNEKIVISGNYLSSMRSNLVHEISHAIDDHLEDDEFYTSITYLDEREWSRMNPDDFEYYYEYMDENNIGYETSGSTEYTPYSDQYLRTGYINGVYFIDTYSKTYPTEDRARLMETALGEGTYPDYIEGKHIQEKLAYYFSAIRAVWDSSEWPACTSWEKALDGDYPLIPADQLVGLNEGGEAA